MKYHLFSLASCLAFALPLMASAGGGFDLGAAQAVGLPGGLQNLIGKLIQAALTLVGTAALAYLVYGGFLYITAAGDEKQISKAKTILTYAIIGIVVIGLSFAIVQFVIGAFQGGAGGGQGGGQNIRRPL